VGLGVTDSNGVTVRIHPVTVQVYAALTATPASTTYQGTVGHLITISVNVSGGDPPYASSWTGLPAGCISTNSTRISCTPTNGGTFSVGFQVKDALGGSSNASMAVSLSSSVAGTGLSTTQLGIIGVVVVVIVVAAVVGLLLRRRSAGRPPEEPMADPPPTESEAPESGSQ
jgi:hypothetical protein